MVNYLLISLGFLSIVSTWETYLELRQLQKLKETKKPPPEASELQDEKTFEKARLYGIDKSNYNILVGIIGIVQNLIIVLFGVLPLTWTFSDELLQQYAPSFRTETYQSCVFIIIHTIIETIIGLPTSYYYEFVLEERHGFNKQTTYLWITDNIKFFFLRVIFSLPLVIGFVYLVQNVGEQFYLYMWFFLFAFQLLLMVIYPSVIQPLFNKLEILEEGELKNKIFALAQRVHFPLKKIFVIDGSKRSAHSNAYFYGLFNEKMIVLYDTLIKQSSHDELLGILGHEIGHWALWHLPKRVLLIQGNLFTILYLFAYFIDTPELYESFGFAKGVKPAIVGLLLFVMMLHPVQAVYGWFMNISSRSDEHAADVYSIKLGFGEQLKSGLKKISTENLSNLVPDPIYSSWHHSHPHMIERLSFIDAQMKKVK